ncbi:hypothetical protein GCM10011351_00140 [Paraliobacillus quinghaiensis]|uniref:DUF4083 domain-containing protein n=1 Tax=Paraliobacillus quinghaiensis TaxID=470815 RepID=A0A917TD54_9BACI|nr:hypothetical protein [Paraliobacillus quinghaiensis]GGM18327.1 hypothetical protein GCM10011351_00140 [Paraliobacillus quinghaiensis]
MGFMSFNIFALFSILFVYVGVPLVIIYLLIWVYQIKKNSDQQIKQNNEIIDLLKKLDK